MAIISVGSEEASRREILLDDLQKMEEEISKFYEKPKPKRRPIRRWPEMKFAVGMIVKLIDVPKIEGVIIGWRSPYLRNDSYIVWGSYAVVGENNKLYYFEEARLCKAERRKPFNNNTLGKYFCRFEDNHYVPNEMLANDYPLDISYLSNNS